LQNYPHRFPPARQDESVIVQCFLLCEIIFSERSDVTPRHYDCQGAGMLT